jgi:hypothetical protein
VRIHLAVRRERQPDVSEIDDVEFDDVRRGAQAQLPNGVADIGPPGDGVRSF